MVTVPDASALRTRLALREAERAAVAERERSAAEAAHQRWVEALRSPTLPPDAEERLARRIALALEQGKLEIELFRFPPEITNDRARAINQAEPGWESTLTGLPKIAYDYWARNLRDKGYTLRAEVVAFPGGMPGDCALYLGWGE